MASGREIFTAAANNSSLRLVGGDKTRKNSTGCRVVKRAKQSIHIYRANLMGCTRFTQSYSLKTIGLLSPTKVRLEHVRFSPTRNTSTSRAKRREVFGESHEGSELHPFTDDL